jgi:hypothetical protein
VLEKSKRAKSQALRMSLQYEASEHRDKLVANQAQWQISQWDLMIVRCLHDGLGSQLSGNYHRRTVDIRCMGLVLQEGHYHPCRTYPDTWWTAAIGCCTGRCLHN